MDGLILIDKPQNFTSFGVVASMRKILSQKRIGHTGTLDPMATGVLPLLVGKATRLCEIMPDSDKEYLAGIKLGLTTDTLDIWGNVRQKTKSHITADGFKEALARFVGEIDQIPPMFSAVSQNGKRLYELARQGIEVERPSRKVTVFGADLEKYDLENQEFTVRIACSKGTYIRSIADDIGKALGTGGVISSLRRTKACGFDIARCITLEEAKNIPKDQLVIPMEKAVEGFKKITVTQAQAIRFSNGGVLDADRLDLPEGVEKYTDYVGVFSPDERVIGIGFFSEDRSCLKIKCIFN